MKQFFVSLCFLIVSSLSKADLNIQDGNYRITTFGDSSSMNVLVLGPHNGGINVFIDSKNGGSILVNASPPYYSHGGFIFETVIASQLSTPCTIEGIDPNNPLAAVVKNCVLFGDFQLEGPNFSGFYLWTVEASFDANGVGTFTLTPGAEHPGVLGPRPQIGSFQATFAQLLLMLY